MWTGTAIMADTKKKIWAKKKYSFRSFRMIEEHALSGWWERVSEWVKEIDCRYYYYYFDATYEPTMDSISLRVVHDGMETEERNAHEFHSTSNVVGRQTERERERNPFQNAERAPARLPAGSKSATHVALPHQTHRRVQTIAPMHIQHDKRIHVFIDMPKSISVERKLNL